jgi:glycerophosphoryl diester phosphodiesterase
MAKTIAWKPLWDRRRQLLSCALLFQIAEGLFFLPLLGLAGKALAGRPVVDSTELVSFALSPLGFLLLFLGAAASLTIRLLEHAGLSAIALGALQGETVRARAALRFMLRELPRLASIVVCAIGWGLLVAAPVLAVGAWLFVRWRLVVQACVFDRRHGRAAFREAAVLSRGVWWLLAWRCIAVLSFELALALAAVGVGQVAAWLVLGVGGMGTLSLAVSFGVLVLLRTVISAAVISTGACVDAGVFTVFYQKRRQALSGELAPPAIAVMAGASAPAPRFAHGLAAAIVIGLCASAVFSVFAAVDALKDERPITVTAHRGVHLKAPENTAAAIREAIAVGAQFAEIDVQLSKDGVLVVTHDNDFSRMAGVAKKVWDLTYDEIRAIPLGAHATPEYHNEPAPRFDEVLAIAKDRIKLNVELKCYGDHEPRLAERVVTEVRAGGMANQVIIQCLEYEPLQEVRRLAPEIPVGYLLSVNARHPSRLEVNFLGAALSRATGAFVRAAHRRGQQVHVWTVDKPESMEQMIDVGVDSLITNEPAEALRRVREYESLSRAERALREVRAWLAQ